MINYDYLSCTDYKGTTKMLDMFPSELPSVTGTKLAIASTDASDPTLVHVHKASAASDELVKGDGTGLTISALFLAMHPVGSIFMTVDSSNPAELYGGTWVAWGAGRVPIGVNVADADFDRVEKIGGNKNSVASHTHTLDISVTLDEAGEHAHDLLTYTAASKTSIENAYSPAHTISGSAKPYLVFGYDDNIQRVILKSNDTLQYPDISNTIAYSSTDFYILNSGKHTHAANTTGSVESAGTENGNLQPYITCYMWKRIA